MRTRLIIAIDGPSGAGKGTVARGIAARLDYRHVDTGAMYRALAWKAVQEGLDLADEGALEALARRARDRDRRRRRPRRRRGCGAAIRTPEIDAAAAAVARLPRVRAILSAQQRAMGAGGGMVMEGRDIGTVVFPDAEVKMFLDASPEERARRRAHDPAARRGADRGRDRRGGHRAGCSRSQRSDPRRGPAGPGRRRGGDRHDRAVG